MAILVTTVVLRSVIQNPSPELRLFNNFFIAGSILFGGGPVVVPLLQGYTSQIVSTQDFLIGFSILQAFPGPNFNFAVYLGTLSIPSNPVLGGFLGFVAIFSPGLLLKFALLPIYSKIKHNPRIRATLIGLNCAAIGLIWGSVYRLWTVGLLTDLGGASLEKSG